MEQFNTKHKILLDTEFEIRSAIDTDIPMLTYLLSNWSSYYQDKWKQKLENKLDIFVATINDLPIVNLLLDWTKYADQNTAQISSFMVLSPFRNLGIGTVMMDFAEKVIIQKNLKIAQTGAYKTNLKAKKLYERLGYELTGEQQGTLQYTTESGKIETKYEDCWILQKKLG